MLKVRADSCLADCHGGDQPSPKTQMEKDVQYWRRQDWARPLWVQTLLSLPPSVVLLTSWYSQSPRAIADEDGRLFPKDSVFTLEFYGG